MKISILGTGQWGTSLAQVLTDAGNEVLMWGRNADVIEQINSDHVNDRSLPGIKLAESISGTTNIK